MHAKRWAVLAVTVATTISMTAVAHAGSGSAAPTATDVGVTADEIHIGVIADVDNALYPGFFAGSVAGVEGAAKYLNKQGGLAGRKIVIDFHDSKLNADEARNAVIAACEQDFAIVGTSALFLANVDDLVGCKDAAGKPTGLPDVPVVVTEVPQQCSPVSFPINPPALDCATATQHPQTYQYNAHEIPYFKKKYGKLRGYFLVPNDLKAISDSTAVAVAAIEQAGVEKVGETQLSLTSTRAAMTPAVQSIKDTDANYVFARVPFPPLRQEAKVQGATNVDVWDCELACYDNKVIQDGGQDIEGQYVSLLFLPFNETKSNKMLANFIKYTDPAHQDGYAIQAFAGMIALRDAVQAVTKDGGDDALTREALLGALADLHKFDADGMIAPTDIGARKVLGCGIVLQIKNQEFVRVEPKKPGTFTCNPKTVQKVKLDLLK